MTKLYKTILDRLLSSSFLRFAFSNSSSGYAFKMGDEGLGYYNDEPLEIEAASRGSFPVLGALRITIRHYQTLSDIVRHCQT